MTSSLKTSLWCSKWKEIWGGERGGGVCVGGGGG